LVDSGLLLTVVTNAPGVAEAVADAPGVTHILLGGQLRKLSDCLVGPLATENLNLDMDDVMADTLTAWQPHH
jgi:DeoR/GlpR family transcriptional regulator of sugar metabolism